MEMYYMIFTVIVIVFSAVVHEVMHGVAADRLGDPTARYAGRLTLNPIPHLDLWGSVLIPGILALSGSPLFFGWAKPIPYNPYNLRPGRFSEAIVAFAGPLSNLAIALIAGVILRLGVVSQSAAELLFIVVLVNSMLFLFNLLPIPPLDGSKILSALLPRPLSYGYDAWRSRMEMNPILSMGLVLLIVLFFGRVFGGYVFDVARVIAGA